MKSLPGSGYFSKYYIALDGRFNRNANCIESIEIAQPSGTQRVYADEFISTMPLADLIACIVPSPPEEVRAAAKRLKYRGSSQYKSRG